MSMKALVTAVLILEGTLCVPLLSSAQTESACAIAVPLKGITIDGKLDDWPAGLEKHWILHNGQVYGPTDIDDADLKTSADLSPTFTVGYNPEENLVYIAVTVRDDVEMAGYGWNVTDAVEVYAEGRRERKSVAPNSFDVGSLTALQYTLSPPGGSYDTKQAGQPEPKNPRMFMADITKTRTRAAYSHQGDISIYEFAIEAFDKFPDAPTKLIPGKIIGLDVVCNDVDSTGAPAWVCWGTFKPYKFFNADTLGDVLIAADPARLGTISGVVSESVSKGPFKGFQFGVYRAEEFLGCYQTDDAGRYTVRLPAGAYAFKPGPKQGVSTESATKVTVRAGGTAVANFTPKPAALPPILMRSAAIYRNLAGYRDSTIIDEKTIADGGEKNTRHNMSLAFARPNKLRFESGVSDDPDVVSLYSDGEDMITLLVNGKRFIRSKTPEKLEASSVDSPVWQAAGGMLDLVFLLSDDPVKVILKYSESIRIIGKRTIDGIPSTGIRIVMSGDPFYSGRMNIRPIPIMRRSGAVDTVTVWFGDRDALIRSVAFRLNLEKMGEGLPEQMREKFKGIADITIRHRKMELNPAFSPTAFAFTAPEGVQEMIISSPERAMSTAPKKKDISGKPAPDFTLKDVDGKEMSLADCRDCVVVLDFWASLNDPSVKTLELVQKIHQQFEGKNVRVIGINEFEDEDPDTFRSFLKERGITHRILKDTEGTMVEKFGFTKIPACFVIDKKGIVRQSYNEKPDGAELTALVTRLLNE